MVEQIVTATSSLSIWFYILILVLILIIALTIFLIKKGRGNFKPTLWKVIVSILAIILWILLLGSLKYNVMCKICVPTQCMPDYGNWMIVKPVCDCGCQSFSQMLSSNLQHILIPFALVYVIWSLFQRRKK